MGKNQCAIIFIIDSYSLCLVSSVSSDLVVVLRWADLSPSLVLASQK